MNNKNKTFYIFLSFILIIIFYAIYGLYGVYDINKNNSLLFNKKKDYIFHKKYSKKLHHLRDSNRWGEFQNDYLFSIINNVSNTKKTIMFQGDSWIESIAEIESSKKLLKNFAKKNNFKIINAGITSYAPSVMNAQYKILKKDFNFVPDMLIIYIDQTDLGDEFCRYRHNKVYSSEKEFLYVKNEQYNKAIYDYTKIYEYSDLKFQKLGFKILKYPFIKIRFFLKRNLNQIKQIISEGYSNKNFKKCSFEYIQKELINPNRDSVKNFNISLNEYFNNLKKETEIKKIFIVTFPHLNHHKKIYKVNISNLIDEFLKDFDDKRIQHLNMSKIEYVKENYDTIYKKDLASHLKDEFHTSIFLKSILNQLSN